MSVDGFHLARFVDAQSGVFDRALDELRAGCKRTHWIWFIFPQLKGLGLSPTAQFYGITGLGEAAAYLQHPILGERLVTAVEAVIDSPAATLKLLFGSPDDLKFRSSMTLFDVAGPKGPFRSALAKWCDDQADPRTLALLDRTRAS